MSDLQEKYVRITRRQWKIGTGEGLSEGTKTGSVRARGRGRLCSPCTLHAGLRRSPEKS